MNLTEELYGKYFLTFTFVALYVLITGPHTLRHQHENLVKYTICSAIYSLSLLFLIEYNSLQKRDYYAIIQLALYQAISILTLRAFRLYLSLGLFQPIFMILYLYNSEFIKTQVALITISILTLGFAIVKLVEMYSVKKLRLSVIVLAQLLTILAILPILYYPVIRQINVIQMQQIKENDSNNSLEQGATTQNTNSGVIDHQQRLYSMDQDDVIGKLIFAGIGGFIIILALIFIGASFKGFHSVISDQLRNTVSQRDAQGLRKIEESFEMESNIGKEYNIFLRLKHILIIVIGYIYFGYQMFLSEGFKHKTQRQSVYFAILGVLLLGLRHVFIK
eukprot:403340717